MAKTVPVYVSINADNNTITEQPAVEAADGLTEMWVTPVMQEYIIRNWQKYLVVDGMFKRTVDTLPDLSIDHLLHINEVLGDQVTTANTTITGLQKLAGSLTMQQTQLSATVEQAENTIKNLQTLAGQLTAQVTQLQTKDATNA